MNKLDLDMYRTYHKSIEIILAPMDPQRPPYTLNMLYTHTQASKHEQYMLPRTFVGCPNVVDNNLGTNAFIGQPKSFA